MHQDMMGSLFFDYGPYLEPKTPGRYIVLRNDGSTHYTQLSQIGSASTVKSSGSLSLQSSFTDFYYKDSGGSVLFKWKGDSNSDELHLGLYPGYGRALILTKQEWGAVDHGHAVQSNPTLFIHSASSPATDNTQWLSFFHNESHGIIETGKGNLELRPFNRRVRLDVAISAPTDVMLEKTLEFYVNQSTHKLYAKYHDDAGNDHTFEISTW